MTRATLRRLLLLSLPAISLISACGEDGATAELPGPRISVDSAGGGVITGNVTFAGTQPPPRSIESGSDPVCAATLAGAPPELSQEVASVDGRLANVFVYVSGGLEGHTLPPTTPAVLDQRGCLFRPHVLGVVAGQPVEFHNSDSTLHNIRAAAAKNEPFNIGQDGAGVVNRHTFTTPEVMIPLSCDVHSWMRSYIAVLPHPFFDVTGKDGGFTLRGLPPGTYTVTAWHERLGEKSQQLTVGAGATANATFSYELK